MTRGSKLQIQLYVNRHSDKFTDLVLLGFPALTAREPFVRWTAPLETDDFHEPQDLDFLRSIEREDLWPALQEFWPRRGPVWDALAVLEFDDDSTGVLLTEAKAHPEEIYGGGSAATPDSRKQIEAALRRTQNWLGIDLPVEQWLDPLRSDGLGHSSVYQSANRLAHLYWLREVAGVDAWLAHVLFLDDRTYRPTTRAQWEDALPKIEADLGLSGVRIDWATHVFVPALDPST